MIEQYQNLVEKADWLLNFIESGKLSHPEPGALAQKLNDLSAAVSAAKQANSIPAYLVVDLPSAKRLVKNIKERGIGTTKAKVGVLRVRVDATRQLRSSEGECQINGLSFIEAIERI